MAGPSQSFTRNVLLREMSADDFALLQPHLERVALAPRDYLFRAHQPIASVHFLEGGVASVVWSHFGEGIEVGLFGREGMSGSPVILGAGQSPYESYMQVDGTTALRMGPAPLLDACRRSETLDLLLRRYAYTQEIQIAHTAAANAQHDIVERLARWLLMCHDRIDGDEFKITHDFLAIMLACRRSGVTLALHALEECRAISSKRGLLRVLDRDVLEGIADSAYGGPEDEYARLIRPFDKRVVERPIAVDA
jgi:CRP-like cAMP-binding protein